MAGLRRPAFEFRDDLVQGHAARLEENEEMIKDIRGFANDWNFIPLDGRDHQFHRLLAEFFGHAGRAFFEQGLGVGFFRAGAGAGFELAQGAEQVQPVEASTL